MAWNRPTNQQQTQASLRRGRGFHPAMRVVIAGVVAVLGAGIAAWFIGSSEKQHQAATSAKRKSRIKEVAHVAAKTNQAPVVAENPSKPRKTYVDEKGVLRYEGGMVVRKPPVRTLKVGDHTPSIFKHVAEMQIEGLLSIEPGEMLLGKSHYGKAFTESLKESFNDEIVIDPNDDERTRELKQAVIDVKAELKSRLDKGEDVAKLMADTRDDLQRLGMYRVELQNQVRDILSKQSDTMTDQDVKECYEAANLMLEQKGVPKLRMPGKFFVQAMRKSALKYKEESKK